LNNATFSYVSNRVEMADALRVRVIGNLACDTRAYGNLKMNSGDFDANSEYLEADNGLQRDSHAALTITREQRSKTRTIRFSCIFFPHSGANDDRTVARQMKALAFSKFARALLT